MLAEWGLWGLGVILLGMLYLVDYWVPVKVAGSWASLFLTLRLRYLLAGSLCGGLGAQTSNVYFETCMLYGIVFCFCWFGLVTGMHLEGRALQRQTWVAVLLEGGIMCLTVAFVLFIYYLATRMPSGVRLNLNSHTILIIGGLCVVAQTLSPGAILPGRGIERRIWKPTLATLYGIGLAMWGTIQTYDGVFEMVFSLEFTGDWVISGLNSQLIFACLLGAAIGIIGDLLSRDELPEVGLFFLIAMVLLSGGGIARVLGLEPLLVGVVAGIWIINSTLYRLPIIQMVEGRHRSVRLTLIFICGGLIGHQMVLDSIDWILAGWVFVLIVLGRTVARLGEVELGIRFLDKRALRRMRLQLPQQVGLDDIGVVLALHLWLILERPQGVAVVAAALLGQVFLYYIGLLLKTKEGGSRWTLVEQRDPS